MYVVVVALVWVNWQECHARVVCIQFGTYLTQLPLPRDVPDNEEHDSVAAHGEIQGMRGDEARILLPCIASL